MFEQTFVDGVGKTHKPWTVVVSFLVQLIGITAAIIIPLLFTDALPKTQLTSFLVAPPPPPPPPPPPAAAAPKIVKVIPRQFDAGKLMQPKAIPKEITMIKEEELPAASGVQGVVGGVPGGVPGGVAGGVIGGIIGSVPAAAPPPLSPQRLRVGVTLQPALATRPPNPSYPPFAKQARIQGVVPPNAVIGKDGTI